MTPSAGFTVTPETVVARRGEPLTADVDGDLVILDPQRGIYFGLNRVGHRIWELLDRPRSVAELCSAVGKEFEVSAETCQADVLKFLERLSDAELVEIRSKGD